MSRTHRDNQRRLDHRTDRAWLKRYNDRDSNLRCDERPWCFIPRRGLNRRVARLWAWKLHKADRYRADWTQPGKLGRIGII
jgi:hypothetical protein